MKRLGCCVAAVVLTGCGGGGAEGGGATPNPPPPTFDIQAVGVYTSRVETTTIPRFETLMVGPEGRFGVVFEDGFGSSRGFGAGIATASGGRLEGQVTNFDKGRVEAGTFSGTYRPGSGISAQLVYPSGSGLREYAFSFYPTAATGATDAQGAWNASDDRGINVAVQLSATALSMNFGGGCTVTGVAKFADGANTAQLATIDLTSSGAACRFGAGSFSGQMLLSYGGSGRWKGLRGYAMRSDRRDGFEFRSYRCADASTHPSLPLIGC